MNKLELILEYMRKYQARYLAGEHYNESMEEVGNKAEPEDEIYYFVSALMGYTDFVKCVTEKNFKIIEQKELYHGYDKHTHGANFVWDFNFHFGKGEYGQGTYFSTDYEDAMSFTGGYRRDETRVLKAKVLPSKIVKYSQLKSLAENKKTDGINLSDEAIERYNAIIEFIDSLENNDDKALMNKLLFEHPKNFSALAVLLGFDIIENDHRPDFFHGKHFIILNRGKLIVSQKDVKTLLRKSGEKYQGLEFLTTELSELFENS